MRVKVPCTCMRCWCLAPGARPRYLDPHAWYQLLDFRLLVPGTWYWVPVPTCLVPGARFLVP